MSSGDYLKFIDGEPIEARVSRKRECTGYVPPIIEATDLNKTCDQCSAQEDGGHYCLIHSTSVKNMNLRTCEDWMP